MKNTPNFKVSRIIELLLFIIGFYIVFTKFMDQTAQLDQTALDEPVLSEERAVDSVLQHIVICIDVDEENQKPLLAKRSFNKQIDYLYCFAELADESPSAVIFEWMYKDELVARRNVELKEGKQKVWSKLDMSADKSGPWRVVLRDENGGYLGTAHFELK